MHIHLKIHHWVVWWCCIGIVCGAIAMVNIFGRQLTRSQDHDILLVGIIFWAMGGVLAWATEGIEHEPLIFLRPPPELDHRQAAARHPSVSALNPAINRQLQKLAARGISARMKRTHHVDQHL